MPSYYWKEKNKNNKLSYLSPTDWTIAWLLFANHFNNFRKMSLKAAITALACSICDLNDSLIIWCVLSRLFLSCSTLRSHKFSNLSSQSLSVSSRPLFPFREDFPPFSFSFRLSGLEVLLLEVVDESPSSHCKSLLYEYVRSYLACDWKRG